MAADWVGADWVAADWVAAELEAADWVAADWVAADWVAAAQAVVDQVAADWVAVAGWGAASLQRPPGLLGKSRWMGSQTTGTHSGTQASRCSARSPASAGKPRSTRRSC